VLNRTGGHLHFPVRFNLRLCAAVNKTLLNDGLSLNGAAVCHINYIVSLVLPPSRYCHFVFITVIVILSSSLLWSFPPACMVSILDGTNYSLGTPFSGLSNRHALQYSISRLKTCRDLETRFFLLCIYFFSKSHRCCYSLGHPEFLTWKLSSVLFVF